MATSGLKAPKGLSLTGNLAANYTEWLRTFDIYSIASGISTKDEKIQCNVFLHVAGPDAQKVFSTFTFTDQEKDKIAVLKAKFKTYCEGEKNITVTRYRFNTHNQAPDEKFDAYYTSLKAKISECEYGDLADSLLKDRIVCGISDNTLREKLLQTEALTLDKCLSMCRLSEITSNQLKDTTVSVSAVKHKPSQPTFSSSRPSRKQSSTSFTPSSAQGGHSGPRKPSTSKRCGKCGGQWHRAYQDCPAFGKICNYCQKKNHFASVCREAQQQQHQKTARRKVRDIGKEQSDNEEDGFFIGSITSNELKVGSLQKSSWTESLHVQGIPIKFKLDTGSEADIIPKCDFEKISHATLQPTNVKLTSYSGHKLHPIGQANLRVRGKVLTFQIVDSGEPIMGGDSCRMLNLIKRINTMNANEAQNILSDYEDLFTGLGCIRSDYHLFTDPNVLPVVDPPRRIPYAVQNDAKAELERMEHEGVIIRQYEPTPWVNSITIVRKPNKTRICIDPTKLNKAVMRAHHPTKTVEEVVAQMPGAKLFSTLDANAGYWQIKLDEESSKLCTFNTPWGRYRFLRLPFGINTSGDAFNETMQEIFKDMDGVQVLADDILVHGKNPAEHNQRLKRVLETARQCGLKLNRKKCKIGCPAVEYVGHVISKDGLKPSQLHTRAITEMPNPENKEDVQRFIALVGYLQKFVPSLSDKTKPLRQLCEPKTARHWDKAHQDAFDELKTCVANAPVLKYYDVNKPITLQTDASKSGLAAVLMQDDMPIAYGSRALDKTQENYAVIEKELLAIAFGCTKFHQYIFGKQKIRVQTDHKPLLGIMSKPIHMLSARLQRIRMRLLRYHLHIEYIPGKRNYLADALSRAHLPDADNITADDLHEDELEVCILNATDEKL